MYTVQCTHCTVYGVCNTPTEYCTNQFDFSNIDLPFYSNSRSSILVYNYEIRVFRSLLRYVCPLKVKNVNISSREEEPSFFSLLPFIRHFTYSNWRHCFYAIWFCLPYLSTAPTSTLEWSPYPSVLTVAPGCLASVSLL